MQLWYFAIIYNKYLMHNFKAKTYYIYTIKIMDVISCNYVHRFDILMSSISVRFKPAIYIIIVCIEMVSNTQQIKTYINKTNS